MRHGESPWNRTGRVSGWAPIGLTDRGREQATRVGRHIAARYDVDRLYASDLRRATLTARAIADCLGTAHDDIRPEPGWRERDFGVYQGLTDEEVAEADPDLAARYRRGEVPESERPPSGESTAEFRDRVLQGWRALTDDPAGTVVLVTRTAPIVVLLSTVRGIGPQDGFDDHAPANCSLTEVTWDGTAREATVVRENETGVL